MKKFIKCAITNILTFGILIMPLNVYANDAITQKGQESVINLQRNAVINAEQTGYKYKIWNGKQWKRLWSYTYGKWIDPEWTLA
ncbi:hypothetical protein [Clostridium sp. Marseille-P2415]|uniref:hypothetical protein n=1 Tax=Clostridium sp. Marseille-P2415 TaxID=1805471 RepID=UPI000988674C|nr:hypothetical protein [Clostridium sp. Marseille-P2415]